MSSAAPRGVRSLKISGRVVATEQSREALSELRALSRGIAPLFLAHRAHPPLARLDHEAVP